MGIIGLGPPKRAEFHKNGQFLTMLAPFCPTVKLWTIWISFNIVALIDLQCLVLFLLRVRVFTKLEGLWKGVSRHVDLPVKFKIFLARTFWEVPNHFSWIHMQCLIVWPYLFGVIARWVFCVHRKLGEVRHFSNLREVRILQSYWLILALNRKPLSNSPKNLNCWSINS